MKDFEKNIYRKKFIKKELTKTPSHRNSCQLTEYKNEENITPNILRIEEIIPCTNKGNICVYVTVNQCVCAVVG